mmetsp:Transcript_48456/g.97489  ORF Transcript_48456/g.97489 Transcript_48456/m.97489 type:complete len:84 (-) Transcript_48456:196-447(-)
MSKRKDQALRKLVTETQRLEDELETLTSCTTTQESCGTIITYIQDSSKNDYLTTFGETLDPAIEPNPFMLPNRRQGPCVCSIQ